MSLFFKLAAISTLLIFSALDQGNSYTSSKGDGKDTVEIFNKSPCFEEEVYECQAGGGTFDWKSCMCFYR